MFSELLKSALVLVFSFAVRWAFDALGVPLDEATFNAIVAALVSVFLGLFGLEVARSKAPNAFK